MTSQQINKIKKLLNIFHLEVDLDETSEELPIKNMDDILNHNQISSVTNGIWTKVQDDFDSEFSHSDFKIVGSTKEDAPNWLYEVEDDVKTLDWHFLMQKFKSN